MYGQKCDDYFAFPTKIKAGDLRLVGSQTKRQSPLVDHSCRGVVAGRFVFISQSKAT